MRQAPTLPLSRGAIGTGSLVVGAAGVATAIGALPLPAAGILAVGLPALVASIAIPRVTLVLLLFSIPFSSWTKVSVGAFDVTSTDVLVGILMGAWVLRSITQNRIVMRGGPAIGAACVLLGAEIIASTTATSFPSAIKEMLKLGELLALAVYGASMLRAHGDLRFVFWTFMAAGVTEACVGLFQFLTGRGPESFAIGPFIRAYGDFAQPNAFAGYLAMLLPFGIAWSVLSRQRRVGAMVATTILATALLASMSRGAWLGTGIGIAVMALVLSKHAKRVLALGAGLVVLMIPAARIGLIPRSIADRLTVILDNYWIFDVRKVQPEPGNWALVERMAHWQAGWDMAMDHPITGVGPGNYEAVYRDYYLGSWVEALGHAHNLYLNMFAETGIIGLAAFVALTIVVFVRIIQSLRLTTRPEVLEAVPSDELLMRRIMLVGALGAAATFSVHNTFDNMFIHGMGVQFGLILGLVEAQHAMLSAHLRPSEPIPASSILRAST